MRSVEKIIKCVTSFSLKMSKLGNICATNINSQDQYQYLGNCPPTPPLTQQQSIDNNLGLMLS